MENTENSRIFITNINKNINTNDEKGDQSQHYLKGGDSSSPGHQKQSDTAHHHEKQFGISGYGHAEMVPTSAKTAPSSIPGAAKKAYIKTLKATRILNRDNTNETTSTTTTAATSTTTPFMPTISSSTLKNVKLSDEKKDQQPAELTPTPNLTNILPELVENPLRFALLNATNSV